MTDRSRELVKHLGLEPHIEGGYFKRSYASKKSTMANSNSQTDRPLSSCIFYMLTQQSPIGYLHRNKSDIIHFFHEGGPLLYHMITPEGEYRKVTLGKKIELGQQLQLVVPGGVWKASQLTEGKYGLISESVVPGFDYADMELATAKVFKKCHPAHYPKIRDLIKDNAPL